MNGSGLDLISELKVAETKCDSNQLTAKARYRALFKDA
jgi:hypothetical protein